MVDDHPLFRLGLENILQKIPNFEVIAHAESPKEGFQQYQQHRPDIIISDLSFSSASGLSLVKKIRAIPSSCPILILSMHEESFWAEQVLQHGASGYVQKDADTAVVIEAIQKIVSGEIYLSNAIQQKLLRQFSGLTQNNTSLQSLSRREMEVFQYMAQGFSSTDIAKNLYISLKTVQTHQSNIKTKLQQKTLKDLRKLAQGYSSSANE